LLKSLAAIWPINFEKIVMDTKIQII